MMRGGWRAVEGSPEPEPEDKCWNCGSSSPGMYTGDVASDGTEITTCPDCGEVREDV